MRNEESSLIVVLLAVLIACVVLSFGRVRVQTAITPSIA